MEHRGPRQCTLRLAVTAALMLAASHAAAAPADRRIELAPGETRIERLGAPAHIYVDRLDIVRAEMLPSEEVLLETLGTGIATVFFHGDGWVRAWRIYSGTSPDPQARQAALAEVERACPDAELSAPPFRVRITDPNCHEKIVALGEHIVADELELTFDAAGLRAQIKAQEKAIHRARPDQGPLRLFYLGGTLGIEGTLQTPEDVEAVVRAAWSKSAGRLLLDLSKLTVLGPSHRDTPVPPPVRSTGQTATDSASPETPDEAPTIQIIRALPTPPKPSPRANPESHRAKERGRRRGRRAGTTW